MHNLNENETFFKNLQKFSKNTPILWYNSTRRKNKQSTQTIMNPNFKYRKPHT